MQANPESRVNLMQMGHLSFLDGIRGIAILSVFLFHALGASFGFDQLKWNGLIRDFDVTRSFLAMYPLSYGSAGVAIFFVVSGFCIHLSYQKSSNKSWTLFANRRFFRIYPPYLLGIFFFFCVWPWGSFSIDSFERISQLVSHLLAIHNFDERTFFGINPSFWSIAVEIQLYFIYPILIVFTKRLGWKKSMVIIAIIEISIRTIISLNAILTTNRLPLFISASPLAYWLSWSMGAYLCECFLSKQKTRLFHVRLDILCVLVIVFPIFKPTAPFAFLATSLLTATVIERLITEKVQLPKSILFNCVWSHICFLGITSYSFYLIHQPIIGITNLAISAFLPHTSIHPLIKFSLCLAWYPLILFLSFLIYIWVERPSVRFGQFISKRFK